MFRTVPQSIIRSFSLYTQQWFMSYRFADSLRSGSGRNWFRPDPDRKLCVCVQWKTPDDRHRNWPKHVAFYSKNKFEKIVHLVGFIVRMDWDLIITVLLTYWKLCFLQFKLYINELRRKLCIKLDKEKVWRI